MNFNIRAYLYLIIACFLGASMSFAATGMDDGFNVPAGATSVILDVRVNDTYIAAEPCDLTPGFVFGGDTANGGTVTVNANCEVVYVPPIGGNTAGTADFFEYEICDSAGCNANILVVIIFVAANNPPIANPDAGSTPSNVPVVIDVIGNDQDVEDITLDPCNVTVLVQPAVGSVSVGPAPTCNLTYTPVLGITGTFTFDYQVCDSNNACSTATVTVTVRPATPSLTVSKTVDAPAHLAGGIVTYTVDVVNEGMIDGLDVLVVDPLHPDFTLIAAPPFCSLMAANQLRCDLGDIPALTSTSFTFEVELDPDTPHAVIWNAVEVGLDADVFPGGTNNVSAVPFAVQRIADVQMTKTNARTSYNAGGPISWTITLTNAGPTDVCGARLVDILPAGVNNIGWTCTASLTNGGDLTTIEAEDPAGDGRYLGVAAHPDNLHVFASSSIGSLYVLQLDPVSGLLSAGTSVLVPQFDSFEHLLVSPDGLHVYGLSEFDDRIVSFEFDPVGPSLAVGTNNPVAASTNFRGMAMSPDGAHLYVLDGGNVQVFSRDLLTGELALSGSTPLGTMNPMDILVSPDGVHVYVLHANSVDIFDRNATTGLLTTNANSPFSQAGISFFMFDIAPDGRHLYIGSFAPIGGGALATVDRAPATGALTGSGTTPASSLFESVVASSDGKSVYAIETGATGGTIAFSRNEATGATTVEDSLALFDPFDLAVMPNSRHLFTSVGQSLQSIQRAGFTGCDNASGTGNLSELVDITVGGTVTFEVTGVVAVCEGSLTNTAEFTYPANVFSVSSNTSMFATHVDSVLDTIAPTFDCPPDVLFDCSQTVDLRTLGMPFGVMDNCDPAPVVSNVLVITNAGDCLANGSAGSFLRVFEATDASGNSAQCTQMVTIVDTTPPALIVSDITVDCSTVVSTSDVPVFGNGSVVISTDPNTGNPNTLPGWPGGQQPNITNHFGVGGVRWFVAVPGMDHPLTIVEMKVPCGRYIINWTSDVPFACYHYSEPSFDVNFPNYSTFTAPAYTAVSIGGIGPGVGAPSTLGAMPFTATNILDLTQTCSDGSTTHIVQMVFSAYVPGSAGLIANITGNLSLAPAGFEPMVCVATVDPAPPVVVMDNCSDVIVSTTFVGSATSDPCLRVYTNLVTACDACGNCTSALQVITQVDTTALGPVDLGGHLGCQNDGMLPVALPSTADEIAVLAAAADSCSTGVVQFVGGVLLSNDCIATISRTYLVQDACGNQATSAVVYTWDSDTEKPTFTVSNLVVECAADVEALIGSGVAVFDNCNPILQLPTVGALSNTCSGSTDLVYSVTDNCGNAVSFTQTISWIDTTAPVITDCPIDLSLPIGTPFVPDPNAIQAMDNCMAAPVVTVTLNTNSAVGCSEVIFAVFTATDLCGNSATCTQTVTRAVDLSPTITCPPDLTVACIGDILPADLATASATDPCQDVSLIVVTNGSISACPGIMEYVFTATDESGLSAVCTQTVTLLDAELPTYTVSNLVVECAVDVEAAVGSGIAVFDNCRAVLERPTVASLPMSCSGSTDLVYVVSDDCGNAVSYTQTISWVDTIAPVITSCPADLTIAAGTAFVPAPNAVQASDNCMAAPVVTVALSTNPAGVCGEAISAVFTATDLCGNSAVCTQIVNRGLASEPTIDCPPGGSVSCLAAVPPPGTPTVTDPCSTPLVTVTTNTSGTDCAGTVEYIYTALNGFGNAAACTQTFTVANNSAPLIECPPAITLPFGTTVVPDPDSVVATDACGAAATVSGVLGTTTDTAFGQLVEVIYTATDACGNQSITCTQLVSLTDNTPPVITCPGDLALDPGTPFTPDPTSVQVTASCGTATVSVAQSIISNTCGEAIEVVYTATDVCGNTASCTQLVSRGIASVPVIACAADVMVECLGYVPPAGTPSVSDDCATPVVTVTTNVIGDDCSGEVQYIFTASNAFGNNASCTQTITYLDTQAPALICVQSFTVRPRNDQDATVDAADLVVSSSDNCGIVSTEIRGQSVFTCSDTGTGTIQVIVSDACGNATVCDVPLTVAACDEPSLAIDITVDDPGCFCAFGPGSFTISITNNGPIALQNVVLDDPLYPACATNIGALAVGESVVYMCEVTLTGTVNTVIGSGTGNGLTATAEKTVNYAFDTNAPMISACPPDLVLACGDPLPDPDTTGLGASDDCTTPPVVQVSSTPISSCAGDGIAYVYQLEDACGNLSAPCTQRITRVDTSAPVFDTSVTDRVLPCGSALPEPETLSASDDCGAVATLSVNQNPLPASCTLLDGVMFIYSASDACGNTATMTQRITIAEGPAPTLSATPAGAVLGCGSDLLPPANLTAVQGCDGESLPVTVTTEAVPAGCAGQAGVRYVYRTSDGCGQTVEHIQEFTIADATAPQLECATTTTVFLASGDCMIQVPEVVPTTLNDNCSEPSLVQTPAAGSVHDARSPLTILLTATDACGNQSQCEASYIYVCEVSVSGTVWLDLSMDFDPDNDDLGVLGIRNVRVILSDPAGNQITTTMTGANGAYSFDVPPGMYVITFDPDTLPSDQFSIEPSPVDATGGSVQAANLGIAVLPTAISLERIDATIAAEGVRITWTTAWEDDTLGYRVWRGDAESAPEALDGFVVAENQAATYEVLDATAPASHYWLEVIDTDLSSKFEAVATTTIPAPPTGPADHVLEAVDGAIAFEMPAAGNVLVIGFASEPNATETTTGLRYGGDLLQTESGFGLYLGLPASAKVRVSE